MLNNSHATVQRHAGRSAHVIDLLRCRFGKEVTLRANVEEVLRERYRIPGVLIVILGGVSTLDTVLRHLKKDCPVILVRSLDDARQGDDGAADLLSACYDDNGTTFRTEMVDGAIRLAEEGGASSLLRVSRPDERVHEARVYYERFVGFLETGAHSTALDSAHSSVASLSMPNGTGRASHRGSDAPPPDPSLVAGRARGEVDVARRTFFAKSGAGRPLEALRTIRAKHNLMSVFSTSQSQRFDVAVLHASMAPCERAP